MSLSDLASLGSFASGIAVIVSLISLTIQIRQNTHVMIRAELNAAQEQTSNWRLAIANSAELTDIWTRGSRDEDLNEIEEARYSLLLNDLAFMLVQSWDRTNRGFAPANVWARVVGRLAVTLTTKRGAAWWEQNRDFFHSDYVAAVDAAIRGGRANGPSVTRSDDYSNSSRPA